MTAYLCSKNQILCNIFLVRFLKHLFQDFKILILDKNPPIPIRHLYNLRHGFRHGQFAYGYVFGGNY